MTPEEQRQFDLNNEIIRLANDYFRRYPNRI